MAEVSVESDIVYGDAGGRALRLDLYRPAEPNGAGVVIVHGGGWSRGVKRQLGPAATLLAEQGFVVMAPEYRLTGEAPFPANLHDVRRAIGWAKREANRLGFDAGKLCLEGHSAGAHLVLLAAAGPEDPRLAPPEGGLGDQRVAAVCAIYPPVLFHLGEARPSGSLPAQVLPGADASAEMAALASPIEHVAAGYPPVMLLHGDADKVVPVSASRRFEEKVRAVGGKADLHIYAGLPHGFANHPDIRPAMMRMIGGFFRRWAIAPEAFPDRPMALEPAGA